MSSRSAAPLQRGLVRIVIVADTHSRAQALAAVMAEDDRLEILSAASLSSLSDTDDEQGQPDVAVTVALAPGLIPRFPCPIVALSIDPEIHSLASAKLHASLPLNSSVQEITAAILAASCDLSVFTRQQLRQWQRDAGNGNSAEPSESVEKLTVRELQVLRLLADGLGNKQIAGLLGLSSHTAKFHVAQILAKLGAASRTEAVAIGIRRGLVPL